MDNPEIAMVLTHSLRSMRSLRLHQSSPLTAFRHAQGPRKQKRCLPVRVRTQTDRAEYRLPPHTSKRALDASAADVDTTESETRPLSLRSYLITRRITNRTAMRPRAHPRFTDCSSVTRGCATKRPRVLCRGHGRPRPRKAG